jgi:GT2 family glycosyltransferase
MTPCTIIIPVYNRLPLTKQCIDALQQTTSAGSAEIVVVDNGSTDGTGAYLRDRSGIRAITNPRNLGFAAACNQGARNAQGDILIFLNNDTIPQPGWLDPLEEAMRSDPQVGIAGSKLLYADGTIQHAGVAFFYDGTPYHIYLGHPGNASHVNYRRDFKAVTGACLAIRRDLFEREKGFDEGFQNGLEDIDLCLRIGKTGALVRYCPQSEIVHLESQTEGRADNVDRNRKIFEQRWGTCELQDDFRYLDADGMEVVMPPGSCAPQFWTRQVVDYQLASSFAQAMQLRMSKDYPRALSVFIQLARIVPNRIEFLNAIAELARLTGNTELAESVRSRLQYRS